MIWMSWILEPGRLLAINSLRQGAMKKGILHIELVNRPPAGQSQGEHCADGCRLHDGTKRLIKVNTRSLSEATKDPSGLIPLKGAIRPKLVLKNPLACDDERIGLGIN